VVACGPDVPGTQASCVRVLCVLFDARSKIGTKHTTNSYRMKPGVPAGRCDILPHIRPIDNRWSMRLAGVTARVFVVLVPASRRSYQDSNTPGPKFVAERDDFEPGHNDRHVHAADNHQPMPNLARFELGGVVWHRDVSCPCACRVSHTGKARYADTDTPEPDNARIAEHTIDLYSIEVWRLRACRYPGPVEPVMRRGTATNTNS